MRLAILLAVPFVMGFGPANQVPADTPQPLPFDMPGYSRPAPLATGDLGDFVKRATCRDTIEHTRQESGQPPLDERDSEAPAPMLYKAVDHDVDGCDVLVMANDTDDIRPVPEGGPAVIQPIKRK
ncbi:hypothetical protein [Alteriqipengyuania lutimaris]|uniref:Uncharacterized protein n=1 Tax=Alteriqipengyuania lutimaris TaxID=1538146 RepID=A0A395LU40_9SPHN|nr:hypothetical protein [Alteriqipengyuania lutimaris]MBB3032915.1 hypothetical protein [Alteriqipengyuania lutimaris]RDS78000.1 hypothetical protein DL238_10580 [Alteriqipengyuania lutimaris]